MVEGSLDMSIAQAFLLGSHLAVQLWAWLGMLQWPPELEWKSAPACWGVSFLELVINFSQCSGVAIPRLHTFATLPLVLLDGPSDSFGRSHIPNAPCMQYLPVVNVGKYTIHGCYGYFYVVQALHQFIQQKVFWYLKWRNPHLCVSWMEMVYVRETSPLQNAQYLHVRSMKFSLNSFLLIVYH